MTDESGETSPAEKPEPDEVLEPALPGDADETRESDEAAEPNKAAEPEEPPEPDEAAESDGAEGAAAGRSASGDADTPDDVPAPETAGDTEPEPKSAWRQLGEAVIRPRLTAANLIIALLIGLLGFALITQVKANTNASSLQNDRPDDLVRILSDLDSRKDRLNSEITSLQETERQLTSGQPSQAALRAAQQRADELGILAGTLPAQGPGLLIQFVPAQGSTTHAVVVLSAIEELRGAGAEAIQIADPSGSTVRVVADTWFTDASGGGLDVSGRTLTGTLTITAIGDPQTMQTALTIPGGVNDSVAQDGGSVKVTQPGTVYVTALAPQSPMTYAKPAS